MTLDADEIVVGANGKVWAGPTTATAPTNATTAMADPWADMGFVSEDGVTFTDARTMAEITAWQSFYPVRRIVASRDATVAFVLRQWNTATVKFALGGGAITGSGPYTYTPPSPEVLDERSLVVEWSDGTRDYRLYIPKGIVTENVETQLVRTAAADLPITFGVTPGSGDDPYLLFTDDSGWADLGTGS